MLDRRRVIRGGLAAAGSLTVGAPVRALAQRKPAAKVRYNEVVRSVLYVPAYVAIAKGYFEEPGIDMTMAPRRAATNRWRRCCPMPPTSR